MAEEREVVARLKIQKEGEEDAFEQAVADLEQLAGIGPEAAASLESISEASTAAGESTTDLAGAAAAAVPAVGGLGSTASVAASQLGGLATATDKAAGETGELTTAQSTAKKIMEEWGLGAERVEKASKSAAEATGELAESTGEIGKAGEGTAGKLGELSAKALLVAGAFQAGYSTGEKLREGLNYLTDNGLDNAIQGIVNFHLRMIESDRAAEDNARSLERMQNAARILKANGIDPTNLSLAEMDKAIEELSRKKHDDAKATEELARAHEELAAEMGLSNKALTEGSTKLTDFISTFAKANQQLSDSDLAEIFKKPLQEMLDGFERLGQEAPQALRQIAQGFGVVSSSIEKEAERSKKAVADLVSEITGETSKLAPDLEKHAEAIRGAFEQLQPGDLDFGSEALARAKQVLQQYVDASRAAGQQIPADIADQAAALGVLVGQYEVASTASTGYTESVRDVTSEVQQLTAKFRESGTGAKTAGSDIKEGADKAGEGAKSLQEAGKAGEEAGSGLATAKSGAEGLGKAAEEGKAGVAGMVKELGGIEGPATAAKAAIEQLNSIKLTGLSNELDTILKKLEEIPAKSQAANAALNALDGGPDSGGAS